MSKKSLARFFTHITLPLWQVVAFLTTVFLMILIGYRSYTEFIYSFDPPPEISSIGPQEIQRWGGAPPVVNVGLYIIDFIEFDVIKNRFVFDGVVWFEFDPALISVDLVSKFSFEKGEVLERSAPDFKVISGRLFVQYHVRVRFTSNLDFRAYPFDDHRIYISLANRFVFPAEMIYRVELPSFVFSPSLFTAGWMAKDNRVLTGYAQASLNEFDERKIISYPKVIFSIDFSRVGVQGIFLIILPILLICFIGMYAFALDPATNSGLMLSLASGSIASMIAYRFIIQQISPSVGYFMLSDYLFTFFLTASFTNFAMTIFLIRLKRLTQNLAIARGILFLSVHVLLLVGWFIMLNYVLAP